MSPGVAEGADERLRAAGGTVVGVGVTAFPRAGLAGMVPGYRIVCLRETADLAELRRSAGVFCLEECLGRPVPGPENSTALLSHPATRRYLSALPRPVHLLLYQSYPELEDLARREGWHLLANPAGLRIRTADRAFFQMTVRRLGLPPVPGAIVSLGRFLERDYEVWAGAVSPRLAVQLPDLLQGGGRATFFAESEAQFRAIQARIRDGWWQGRRVLRVSVRRRMKGDPASVAACISPSGVHVSPLQRQIIDPPWVSGVVSNGVFGGHSWGGAPWPEGSERQARDQALRMARVLAFMGYRGIFGLDLLVDPLKGGVIPVELNPRLTGLFPVLTQLQAARGETPLELIHVLSLLGSGESASVREAEEADPSPFQGSHLVLFRGTGRRLRSSGLPRPGVYSREALRRVGESVSLREMGGKDRFVLADGPPAARRRESGEIDPLERVARLIFPSPVLRAQGRFDPAALDTVARMEARLFES